MEMQAAIQEIRGLLASQGVKPCGPWFTHHFRTPTDTFDFEVCFPVTQPIVASGRVQNSELAEAKVARTEYRGDYSGLGPAWGQLMTWIAEQGLQTRDDLWEVYLQEGPEPVTQLNRPLL